MHSQASLTRANAGVGRVAALDGLRALAIAAVIGFHISPRLLPGGWVGVDLFFVLSGYLITDLLNRELQTYGHIDFAGFAGRRGLRIVPALFAMLAVYGLYAWLCTRHPEQQVEAMTIAASFATNWARAFGTAAEGPLGHTWSLATEEQFYLLWPFALVAFGARHRVRWAVGLLAAVVCWRGALAIGGAGFERTYNGFDTHTDGLLLGAVLALAPPGRGLREFALRWVAVPLGFLTAVLVVMSYKSAVVQAVGMAGCAVCCGWVLVAAMEPSRLSRALSIWPLRYAGRVSYSLYLWHLPILMLGHRHVPAGWLGIVVLLGVCGGVSVISYHVVELPFLALRQRGRALAVGRALSA